jgi:diguanylate cyclase (GGDEF)-like protein
VDTYAPEEFLIMLVDDSQQNLELILEILENFGYGTLVATSGTKALQQLEKIIPDLILLDLMMPDMNGFEVCQHLKHNDRWKEIPVIFVTASHNADHILEAFEKGAEDYIMKPYKYAEVLARVKTHLHLHRAKDELEQALIDKEILIKRLEALAHTDELTKILNRREIFRLAEEEFDRARRYENSFALISLDLDHFKTINDNYGHVIGDQALIIFTETCQANIRKNDRFGRVGGEEFLLLLPQADHAKAKATATRINQEVAKIEIPIDNHDVLKFTVSLGITLYSPKDASLDDMINRADQALYAAKNEGRNTFCFSSL